MKHIGECSTDESAKDVCEALYQEKLDDVIALTEALMAIKALVGGHDPQSKEITKICDDAIKEHGIE